MLFTEVFISETNLSFLKGLKSILIKIKRNKTKSLTPT